MKQTLKEAGLTKKQIYNAGLLYEKIGRNVVFGRGRAVDILNCAASTATLLLSKMHHAGVTELAEGQGKGKYRFK